MGAAGERAGAVHRRCLSRERGAQPGDPAQSYGRRAGAAPAGVERRGGAAEAEVGAAVCTGRVDQRLGWFAQRKRGAELRRGGGADGVSCPLAPDSEANR